MLGLVAASLRLSFSQICPLQGARQMARTFCCPTWFLLLLNLVMGHPCLHGAATPGWLLAQVAFTGAWGERLAGRSLHTGTFKAGSYLCSVCDGCSLGSLSEPHTFSQVVSCNTKVQILSYLLFCLTELTLVIIFIGGARTVRCTRSLQVLEKYHHTGNSRFCIVSRFQKLTPKPVFKQGTTLKETENISHSAICTSISNLFLSLYSSQPLI